MQHNDDEHPAAAPRIAIAAGGTGGHIYPALATARALAEIAPEAQVRFLCGCRDVELDIYRREEIEPIVLPIGRFGGGLLGKGRTAWQVWQARRAARQALLEQRPQCLLAMGGYVAFGAVWAAQALQIPIVLHEQNAILGRAHQYAKKWARIIACSYPETIRALHGTPAVLTGNPVREEFAKAEREAGRQFFEIENETYCVVISGGSQGARGVNRLLEEALKYLSAWTWETHQRLTLIWASGAAQEAEARAAAERWADDTLKIDVRPYLDRIDLAYAAADLVVSRAGASTIAELTAGGTPAILIPLPSAIHDHQRLNAQSVVAGGGALMLEEETPPDELARSIVALLTDSARLGEMAQSSRKYGRPEAAERLARLLLAQAKKKVAPKDAKQDVTAEGCDTNQEQEKATGTEDTNDAKKDNAPKENTSEDTAESEPKPEAETAEAPDTNQQPESAESAESAEEPAGQNDSDKPD